MKKVLSILLTAVLLLALVPVGTIGADAAENDVIEIRTIAELFSINNNMSGNYKLMNDIDMTEDTAVGGDWDFMGNGWEPIGSNGVYGNTAFTGTFDGGGHQIIGMRISLSRTPSGAGTIYLGLFANNAGTIKNIDVSGNVGTGSYAGGICGYNSGTITNCHNKAYIKGYTYSGGICGDNSGDIYNCYNEAAISSRQYSGGICGVSSQDISNCNNTGTVESTSSSKSYAGGICGAAQGIIYNCYNKGTINSNSSVSDSTDKRLFSLIVYSYAYCGGICGTSSKDIRNCYNTGKISSNASASATNTYRDSQYYYSASNDIKIPEAYSYGYTGGICGSINTGIINCYNTADVSSSVMSTARYNIKTRYITTGWYSSEGYYVYDGSTKSGKTDTKNFLGGIAGESKGIIQSCYNIGKANYGILGHPGYVNCYYLSGSGYSYSGAKALTEAQLQLEMCMPDFDFENTWVIDKVTDYKYPQLISNRQEEALNPESIEVNIPDKTSYTIGEEFDPSGLIVIGHYDNGISQEIKTYTISGFTGELGRNNITVTVGDKSAVFYVTVHDEGEWKTEKEPTCTESGEKKLYCTDCGALLDTEEIPAKGHKEVIDNGHDATCTKSGLTDGAHCSVCNTILTEQEVIPAKGHTPYLNWETIKSPTCIAHGEKVRYCSICGEIAETADIDVTDHQPVIDEERKATCLTSGLTEGSHCSVCHTVLVPQEVIQPKGHEWDDGEITKQPTCTTTGEKIYHCNNCDKTKSETIPKLGHDYSAEYTIDKQPTCTEDGVKSRHCSRCTAVTDRIVIPKTDHNPSSEWTVVRKATTTEEGLEKKYCLDCGAVVDSRAIPILPPYILGDVDGDGSVMIVDATLIERHIASIPVYAYIESAADTDGDGEITILDATALQYYLAQMRVPYPIGELIS